MLKTKKQNFIVAIISAMVLLFLGLSILLTSSIKANENIINHNVFADEETSGYCGEFDGHGNFSTNAIWNYNSTTKTLTISGTGATGNFPVPEWLPFCREIEHIVVESGITEIGYGFGAGTNDLYYDSIQDISIADSVNIMNDDHCFYYWESLYGSRESLFVTENGVTYLKTTTNNHFMLIGGVGTASYTLHEDTKFIKPYACKNCNYITNLTLNDGLVCIGRFAFNNCTGLTSLNIPKSVRYIGDCAISTAGNITTLTVDAENTVFNDGNGSNVVIETATNKLVAGCNGSTIPNTVKIIDNGAFYGCLTLSSLTIPEGVEKIGDWAFAYCESLEEIAIPDSVKEVCGSAFQDCTSLESITLPKDITYIGSQIFMNCTALRHIEIPSKVTSIYSNAFGNSGLESIVIPDSVEKIDSCFWSCSNLTSITFGNGIKELNGSFNGCDNLTEVYLGKNIKYISPGLFYSENENAKTLNIYINATYENFQRNLSRAITPAQAVVNYTYGVWLEDDMDEDDEVEIRGLLANLTTAIQNYEDNNSEKFNNIKNALIPFKILNGQTEEEYNEYIDEETSCLVNIYKALNSSDEDRLSNVKEALTEWLWEPCSNAEALYLINLVYPSAENEIKGFFESLAMAVADDNLIYVSDDETETPVEPEEPIEQPEENLEESNFEYIINEGYKYNSTFNWDGANVRKTIIHFDDSLTTYYEEVFDGVDSNVVSYNDSYEVPAEPVIPDAPSTGIAVNLTVLSIGLVMGIVALAVVLRKKEQY